MKNVDADTKVAMIVKIGVDVLSPRSQRVMDVRTNTVSYKMRQFRKGPEAAQFKAPREQGSTDSWIKSHKSKKVKGSKAR